MEPPSYDAASIGRWKREHSALERRIETANSFIGLTASAAPVGVGIHLRRGERFFLAVDRAELVEPGRSTVDAAPALDRGVAVITDRRVVFHGANRTREWAFSRLVEHRHYDRRPTTMIEVSNRKRVSGIAYDTAQATDVRFMVDLALAHHRGTLDTFRRDLRRQLLRHDISRPSVHAGAWVWRGWARPVPVGTIVLTVIAVVGALVAGGSDDANTETALGGRGAAGELSALDNAPSFEAADPEDAAGDVTDDATGAGSSTASGGPNNAAATAAAQAAPAVAPASAPACASVVALGPLAVPDPVCAVLGP
jgi:hypothetical protein